MSCVYSANPLYIPLRNHSSYSLLEGSLSVDRLLSIAQNHGVPAIGLADTGHLFGAMEFSVQCHKKGIQPILGCQMSLKDATHTASIVLYAKNTQGYRSLCRLVTASTVGQPADFRGHITWEQLSLYSNGLLALTGGARGPIDMALSAQKEEEARSVLQKLLDIFGDHLYIELSRYTQPASTEDLLIEWAYQLGVPLVATNEAFFAGPEDFDAHDVLRCIALGRYVSETDRPKLTSDYCLKSPSSMEDIFRDLPEAIANTEHLQKRCSFLLEKRTPCLPSFPCTGSEEEELILQARTGLEERLVHEVCPTRTDHVEVRIQYTERLEYELKIIISMGFSGYFLIVADFIQWAKNQDIPVGPGRGSGAGSLVAWCLRITDLDPMAFDLFFERFLNPERVSLPDFDVDFCQERRDEVIAYVAQKYGKEHVAHIITFGSLQARAVLRDVGRVLQIPYSQVDKICKMIPLHPSIDLKEAIRLEPALSKMAQEEESVAHLLDIGKKLEGLYRHASVHAAGLIISKEPLIETLPLYQEESGELAATEFSMKYVEELGLIKFDFLGLKTLTVLQKTMQLLKNRSISINLLRLPLNDAPTFSLLCRAETTGIFQLESSGMSDVLHQLQPESFDELIALVALYRPGPMDDIPRYIACRHGREKVQYAYVCLEDILRCTFGVMVYQEQVLQIAQKLAGYTMGSADVLRRAMGKKIPKEMKAQRAIFIEGVLKNQGGKKEDAELLFDQISKFASYAFPKAHAAAYALISYQTAYMKANYPAEFMASLMTLDVHNTDKLRGFAKEVKKMKIPLLPVDVNKSLSMFSVESLEDGTLGIRYGLSGVKNIGTEIMGQLCDARTVHGPFKDIFDLMKRVPDLNKKHLESLISAGALDSLDHTRWDLFSSVDLLLESARKNHDPEQLFITCPQTLRTGPPWTEQEKLSEEYKALGFYFSAHPLDSVWPSTAILSENMSPGIRTMAGILISIKERVGKTGKRYAFLFLSDPSGDYEVVCFSDILQKSRSFLQVSARLLLRVEARLEGESCRFVAQDIQPLVYEQYEITYAIRCEADILLLQKMLMPLPSGSTKIRLKVFLGQEIVYMRLSKMYEICKETQNSLLPLLLPNSENTL